MMRALACTALVALAVGCTGRTPGARPPATPPAAEGPSQTAVRAPRVAVIDLPRAVRVHRRWPEVVALDRQISELQAKIAQVMGSRSGPVRIELPKVDLAPEMKAAVGRMRPELQQEAEAVKAEARKELDAYVAELRAEQQKKMQARRTEVEAELAKAVQEKQQALNKDTEQFQQRTLAEYRLPLLNLKLKAEDIQQTGKGESEKLNQQLQALTKERDDKIAAHEKANQQALQDFQKEQIAASNARLKSYQEELSKEGQRLLDERTTKLSAQVRTKLEAKQAEFNQRLQKQEQAIVSAARETQTREAERMKAQVEKQLGAESAKVRTLQEELLAAQRGRARLLGVIMADLRIEAATLAQEKGWDVVLTQAIAAPGAIDATDEFVARIKR
jgi:Skp family chaperone for outer membrane proteins